MASVHIYRPAVACKSKTRAKCPDCREESIFVGFHVVWHGWDDTCLRCGRSFADGEWMELAFQRGIRSKMISRARRRWRETDAPVIKRTVVSPDDTGTEQSEGKRERAPAGAAQRSGANSTEERAAEAARTTNT